MSDVGDFGGFGEGTGDYGLQMPGESIEDAIARLKKMGMYGGDVNQLPFMPPVQSMGQPGVAGGGLPGYDRPRSSGQTSDTGPGTTSGIGAGSGQSGKGMWEPDNSGPSPSAGGGGGGGGPSPYGGGNLERHNSLATLMSVMAKSPKHPAGAMDNGMESGVFNSMVGRNLAPQYSLSDLLLRPPPRYVHSTYRNQPNNPNPYPRPQMATNYLQQLMRSGR